MDSATDRPLWRSASVGLCMMVIAVGVTAVSPRHMDALPQGLRTPVVAFEFARSPTEIERMFGRAGSVQRETWRTGMRLGTWLDFALLVAYGAFLVRLALELGALGARKAARLVAGLAIACAGLDVLENRELLAILAALGGDYTGPLARLAWFTWAKWLGLCACFALLAPALWRANAVLRAGAVAGVVAAIAAVPALFARGMAAEVMALAVALAFGLLTIGSFLRVHGTGDAT
jgi:hypothetical protein